MGYKIVFSDIDGTLLDSHHQIPEATAAAIRELEKQGIPFVLVSARMPDAVAPVQTMLGTHAPMVGYSGALIREPDGEIISSCTIPLKLAVEIKELAAREFPQVRSNAYGGSIWLVDGRDFWIKREEEITGFQAQEGDLKTVFEGSDGIHKFLFMGEEPLVVALEERLKELYPGLSIARSKDVYLEVMDGSVCKSAGVETLCRYYGVRMEESVAFGDGHNDLDMILAAGAGYAMRNAPEEVRRAAGRVTLDNDHEGLLAGLRECFGDFLKNG